MIISGVSGGLAQLDGMQVQRLATQNANNGTNTTVSWDTLIYNRGTMWAAGSPTRATIKTAGVYAVMVGLNWAANSFGDRYVFIFKNGATQIAYDQRGAPNGGAVNMMQAHYMGLFSANDYLEIVALQGSGGAVNMGGSTNSFLSVQFVSL